MSANPTPEIPEFWESLDPDVRARLEALPRSSRKRLDEAGRLYWEWIARRGRPPEPLSDAERDPRPPRRPHRPSNNPDARYRALERRAAMGDPQAQDALRVEQLRAGVVTPPSHQLGLGRLASYPASELEQQNPGRGAAWRSAACRTAAMGAVEKYLVPLAAGGRPHARDVAFFPQHGDPVEAAVKGYTVGLRRALISVSEATKTLPKSRADRARLDAAARRAILRESGNPPGRDWSSMGPISYQAPLDTVWQPPGATPGSLSPGEIRALMRQARVTMSDLAKTSDQPLSRIQELVGRGALGARAVYYMLERISAASHAKHLERGLDVTPTGYMGGAGGMFLARARMHHKGAMARKASYVDAYQRLLRFVQLTPSSAPYYEALVDGLRDLGRTLEGDLKVNLGTLKPAAQPNPRSSDADVRVILRDTLAGRLPPDPGTLQILRAIERGELPVEWLAGPRLAAARGYAPDVFSAHVGHVVRVGRGSKAHPAVVITSGAYRGGGGRWTIDADERLARTHTYPPLARLPGEKHPLSLPVSEAWKERRKQTPAWQEVNAAAMRRAQSEQARRERQAQWRLAQRSEYYDPDAHGHLAPNPEST